MKVARIYLRVSTDEQDPLARPRSSRALGSSGYYIAGGTVKLAESRLGRSRMVG